MSSPTVAALVMVIKVSLASRRWPAPGRSATGAGGRREHLPLAVWVHAVGGAVRRGRWVALGAQPGPGVRHGLLDRPAAQPGGVPGGAVAGVQADQLAVRRDPDRQLGPRRYARPRDDVRLDPDQTGRGAGGGLRGLEQAAHGGLARLADRVEDAADPLIRGVQQPGREVAA